MVALLSLITCLAYFSCLVRFNIFAAFRPNSFCVLKMHHVGHMCTLTYDA